MLRLTHIGKRYGSQTALQDVNLEIGSGEFFSLLGPSGCGKTTLMRLIAGLEESGEGQILLDGQRIDALPPQKRPFNMVFQKYALFPHLTIAQNVAFGLQIEGVGAAEARGRVEETLKLVGMGEMGNRYPETLSGGQQQRVALARALVKRPKILLLDEPLSALDQKLREYMQHELRSLQKRLGMTFIFVTHDQEEALVMSDRIGVMHAGRLVEVGTPLQLYNDPQQRFTAGFVGHRNLVAGDCESSQAGGARIRLANGSTVSGLLRGQANPGQGLEAYIRPECIHIAAAGKSLPVTERLANTLTGKVFQRVFRGAMTEFEVDIGAGLRLDVFVAYAEETAAASLVAGDAVELRFDTGDILFYPAGNA